MYLIEFLLTLATGVILTGSLLVCIMIVPETPYWLLTKHRTEKGAPLVGKVQLFEPSLRMILVLISCTVLLLMRPHSSHWAAPLAWP